MEPDDDIFEKAAVVKALVDRLRDHMEQTPFTGASENGRVEIALWGTGCPASVSVSGDLPADVRAALARDIEQALTRCCEARAAFMTAGLDAIQEEADVGPDLQLPF